MVYDPNHPISCEASSELAYGLSQAPTSHTDFFKWPNLVSPHGVHYQIITSAPTHLNPQLHTSLHPPASGLRMYMPFRPPSTPLKSPTDSLPWVTELPFLVVLCVDGLLHTSFSAARNGNLRGRIHSLLSFCITDCLQGLQTAPRHFLWTWVYSHLPD